MKLSRLFLFNDVSCCFGLEDINLTKAHVEIFVDKHLESQDHMGLSTRQCQLEHFLRDRSKGYRSLPYIFQTFVHCRCILYLDESIVNYVHDDEYSLRDLWFLFPKISIVAKRYHSTHSMDTENMGIAIQRD